MSASHETVEQVYRVVRKVLLRHTTEEQTNIVMEKIVDELLEVPGNKSFRETVRRLAGEDAKVRRTT